MEERTLEKKALDEIIGSALTRVGTFIWEEGRLLSGRGWSDWVWKRDREMSAGFV
jgi:hypothetical protein